MAESPMPPLGTPGILFILTGGPPKRRGPLGAPPRAQKQQAARYLLLRAASTPATISLDRFVLQLLQLLLLLWACCVAEAHVVAAFRRLVGCCCSVASAASVVAAASAAASAASGAAVAAAAAGLLQLALGAPGLSLLQRSLALNSIIEDCHDIRLAAAALQGELEVSEGLGFRV